MAGMQHPYFLIFELLLRPCDLSHRVERQRLMVKGGRTCLCVSGMVVLWLTYFYVRISVPMFYLQLCNYILKLRNFESLIEVLRFLMYEIGCILLRSNVAASSITTRIRAALTARIREYWSTNIVSINTYI